MLLDQNQKPERQYGDLHIHTDEFAKRGGELYWHGIKPREAAMAILASGLDVVAITEHNSRENRSVTHWQDVKAIVEEELALTEERTGIRRTIQVLLGTEIPMTHNKFKWHVGHVFEGSFDVRDLPPRDEKLSFDQITRFVTANPGITSLNHFFLALPKEFQHDPMHSRIGRTMKELIESRRFNAMEVLNANMMREEPTATYKTRAAISVGKTLKQRMIAREQALALLGSSDAHQADMIGECSTEFPAGMSIFEAVRAGQTKPMNQVKFSQTNPGATAGN